MKFTEIISAFYQANLDLYRKLKDQSQIHRRAGNMDINQLYEKVHSEAAPCFVLSTGRCGTKLLTQILAENSSIEAQHVPTPELTYYSEFAYKHAANKPEVISRIVDAARYEQIRDAFLLEKQFVETNHRITFFCHALAALFPNARFIHLVRKPEEFITSGLARNWYSGSVLHDEGRITPKKELNQTEKIAWLWNETNAFIEDFKKQQPPERVLTLRSDQLFNSTEATKIVFEFIDLPAPEDAHIAKLISTPVNRQRNKKKPGKAVSDDLLASLTPLRNQYFS